MKANPEVKYNNHSKMTCGNSLSYGSIERETNEDSRVYENCVEEEEGETKQERQSDETESSEQLLNPGIHRPTRNQILGE